ncbi:MAG TPA: ABC transporter permease, partial [Verrucomicrobiae bacterium]|nr:ABC transporter permease [Verrucomicrobiae bacterium]
LARPHSAMTDTDANTVRISPLLVRSLRSEYLILLLCLLYLVCLAPLTPGFTTQGNFANLLTTLLPLFVLAVGQTVVLIGGGIDLSVTSIIGLCSITGAGLMTRDHGWLAGHPLAVPVGLAAMLLSGALVGGFNGLAITWFRMPPFIVTLTSMMFFSGLAIWLTQSKSIGTLPAGFNAIGSRLWMALPVAILLGGGAHFLLSRTVGGRWLYAVGHNPQAARVSGVPTQGVLAATYVLSGLCAAVASILYTGQAESGSPILGQKLLLDIIGATVIGGTSLFGGKGKILWTLFGVLFIKLIDNSLNLLDLSYFTIMMVKGGVILFAALMDALRRKVLA